MALRRLRSRRQRPRGINLWEYTPSTGVWTWIDGRNAINASGVYGTQAKAGPANVPGARCLSTTWVDANGKFWILGGYGIDGAGISRNLNDLWVFDPVTAQWAWMTGASTANASGSYGTQNAFAAANTPGGRLAAAGWVSEGRLWLFGGYTYDANGIPGYSNDVWARVFHPATRLWALRNGANAGPGVYGSKGLAAPKNTPPARSNAGAWTDGKGNLWLFGGEGADSTCQPSAACALGYKNDLWQFQTPAIP